MATEKVDRSEIVKDEPITLKDIYTLYETGKGRRYNLLFSVNGAAFAIVSFLIKDGGNRIIAGWTGLMVAAGMIAFTAIMWWDIFGFGKKMAYLGDRLELFGPDGKLVVSLLAMLLIAAWMGVGWLAALRTM